jgi:DNA-binding transcriptional MocR family regulator
MNPPSLLTLWQRATARDPDLSLGAKSLALALSSYMNTTGACHPAVRTLAGHLGVEERSVQRYRAELVGVGYLDVKEGGGATASRYQAELPVTRVSPVTVETEGDDAAVTAPVTPLSPERSRERSTQRSNGREVDAYASTSLSVTDQERRGAGASP